MALIHCHECGKEISDSAEHCPHCGCKTSHGKGVTQVKVDIIIWAVLAVAGLAGIYFFLTSLFVMRGIPFEDWTYYWSRWEEYRAAQMKLFIGSGLMIGSVVGILRLKNQIDRRGNSTAGSQPKDPVSAAPVSAFIPEDKRKHGTCAKCGAEGLVAECKLPSQFGALDLCPKCISRYNGQIR